MVTGIVTSQPQPSIIFTLYEPAYRLVKVVLVCAPPICAPPTFHNS